jgi:hypothetical protein
LAGRSKAEEEDDAEADALLRQLAM